MCVFLIYLSEPARFNLPVLNYIQLRYPTLVIDREGIYLKGIPPNSVNGLFHFLSLTRRNIVRAVTNDRWSYARSIVRQIESDAEIYAARIITTEGNRSSRGSHRLLSVDVALRMRADRSNCPRVTLIGIIPFSIESDPIDYESLKFFLLLLSLARAAVRRRTSQGLNQRSSACDLSVALGRRVPSGVERRSFEVGCFFFLY